MSNNNIPKERVVTLAGYHGRHNFGDDIFRGVVVNRLSLLAGTKTCYVLCSEQNSFNTYVVGNNTTVKSVTPRPVTIARSKWFYLFIYGLKSDAVIFAAGSIFTNQAFDLIRRVLFYLRKIKSGAINIAALGVSIGPFKNSEIQIKCNKLLQNFDAILLRDESSFSRVSDVVSLEKLHIGYDLALIYPMPKMPVSSSTNKFILGISLTPRAFIGAEQSDSFATLVKAVSEHLSTNPDSTIVAISACTDEMDGDCALTLAFISKLSRYTDRVSFYQHRGENLDESIAVIASCDAVIASRMHVGIVSMLYAIPTLQIDYEPKVRSFYDQHNLDASNLMAPSGYVENDLKDFCINAQNGQLHNHATQQKKSLETCADSLAMQVDIILATL